MNSHPFKPTVSLEADANIYELGLQCAKMARAAGWSRVDINDFCRGLTDSPNNFAAKLFITQHFEVTWLESRDV